MIVKVMKLQLRAIGLWQRFLIYIFSRQACIFFSQDQAA